MDFKLENVVQVFDLIKRITWSSIPLWFSLTIPLIYLAFTKLGPQNTSDTNSQRNQIISKAVLFSCLGLFILGTITLLVDQEQKEKVRKNGLKLKQYFFSKNNFNIPKGNLSSGSAASLNLSANDIDHIVDQYPNEFLQVEDSTIILRDSLYYNRIVSNTEKMLFTYLSDPTNHPIQDIDSLFLVPPQFFTREVVYKLIADSSHRFFFCVLPGGRQGVKRL